MTKQALNWVNTDPALFGKAGKAFIDAKAALERYIIDEARRLKHIDDTETLRFAYRHGQMAFAKISRRDTGNGMASAKDAFAGL